MPGPGQGRAATTCSPATLVFFNTMRRTFSHVGIYIGDNRFVHAPRHGRTCAPTT
jgi:cell wall-associated NlpC family hydrolase